MEEVKVYGTWASPFSVRVEIALKIKGVEYEFVEEDLENKSEELLKYNPVHKKIPVLLHNGKPVAESHVILEYIDETWKDNPLLPTDAYEKSQARFWAKFIDDKLQTAIRDAVLSQGESGEKAKEELHEVFHMLEKEMEGKKFFGGEKVGLVDIVGIFVAYWVPLMQEVVNKELLPREMFPGIYSWIERLLSHNVIKDSLPEKHKTVNKIRERMAFYTAAATSK